VCEAILGAGMGDYYRYRERPAVPQASPPQVSDRLALYDHPEVQRSFVSQCPGGCEAHLFLEDVRCPACLWLTEGRLRQLPGVLDVGVDYAGSSARVRWDPGRIQLSKVLQAIGAIGYRAQPFDPAHREPLLRDQRRRNLERLIFAGVAGMAVMHVAIASYLMGGEDASGTLPLWEVIGRWSSLCATLAILAYAGQDFFIGAWRDLRARRLGMDVPLALGLSAAWMGSLVATLRQQGNVYFDAITMLVFFVLLARYLERRGRVAAAYALDRAMRVVPQGARRLDAAGVEETVPVVELVPGDRVRVRPGESVPADGVIVEGTSHFDEAFLTGEGLPVERTPGQAVPGGAINHDQAVVVRVARTGEASAYAGIRRLLQQAVQSRPALARLSDRAATLLVAVVLVASALTAVGWYAIAPESALANAVALLLVTCPCALALATPVAYLVAAGRYAALGMLPLRLEAVEGLAQVDVWAFDKTGSLTLGQLRCTEIRCPGPIDEASALRLACALEQGSEHPIGKALKALGTGPLPEVAGRRNHPGAGISGRVHGRPLRLGKPAFAQAGLPMTPGSEGGSGEPEECQVMLADEQAVLATFTFADEPRPGLGELVQRLRAQGLRRFAVLSGDREAQVKPLAASLGIAEAHAGLSPEAKLAWLQRRRAAGERVAMVGDGINDAPTLAAADVSISFGHATELAQANSDFLLLGDDVGVLAEGYRLARRTRQILLQNLAWAAVYNALALPAAAFGLIPPWAACIGMSLSSLLVVANSLRLRAHAAPLASNPSREGFKPPRYARLLSRPAGCERLARFL
jgi:Cu2+-exporting ATPase